MLDRVDVVVGVFRAAFKNSALRMVGFAFALFCGAEFGTWIALLVFAYGHGGSTASMAMMLVELVPCTVFSPLIGALADRRRPTHVLCFGYGAQTAAIVGVALAIALRGPTAVVFLLAPIMTIAFTITRPAHAAILPAVVRTPEELTAANVMGGWSDAAASLAGPVVVGMLIAWRGTWWAVLSMAGLTLVSTALVLGIVGSVGVRTSVGSALAPTVTGAEGREIMKWLRAAPRAIADVRSSTWSNVTTCLGHPQMRVTLALQTFYYVLMGSLDLLCVILAFQYLHMGRGGAGYLNAAVGAGALIAGFFTVFLVGRRRMANAMALTLALAVAGLTSVGLARSVGVVVVLLGIVGMFGSIFWVSSQTLFQRSVASDAVAGSFSVLESLLNLGLALGAVLVRVALEVGGLRAALFSPAIAAALLLGGVWRQLRKVDDVATVPQVEIQVLRSVPMFAALAAPALETLARGAKSETRLAGATIVIEGESGHCYYAVADGTLSVTRGGREVQRISRGGGFGELALIRDVPRQATVIAVTDALLLRIDKDPFIEAITGHPSAAAAAEALLATYEPREREGDQGLRDFEAGDE